MKVLIWIGCILIATVLNFILGYATGIKAGYFVFYAVVFFVANKLCRKWDEHKKAKKEQESNQELSFATNEEVSSEQALFCKKCGEKLIENSRFCRKCGTEVIGVEKKPLNKKRDFDNKLKTVYIISLVETILAILFLIVCLNLKYSFSKTEIYYFIAIMFCAIGGIAVFYVLTIAKGRQVVLPIGAFSFVGAAIPLLNENIWNGGNDDCDLFLAFAVALIIALAVTFISVSIKVVLRAYYSSVNYKIKIYKKIEKMSELKERNLLSDEEFDKIEKDMLSKINKA